MINTYFTIGCYFYVKIIATTSEIARDLMFKNFGSDWAFQYNEEEFLPQIEKYNLKLLKTIKE